jgi:hypothetical protein
MHGPCEVIRNNFCFICGEYTPKSNRQGITSLIKEAYLKYFGFSIKIEKWTPTKCCDTCAKTLRGWLHGESRSLAFGRPMIWRDQQDHDNDCYFCGTNTLGFSFKRRRSINYAKVNSVTFPVNHCDLLPVPQPPKNYHYNSIDDNDGSSTDKECDMDEDFKINNEDEPRKIGQGELSEYIRLLHLSKDKAEVFASICKHNNWLTPETHISIYRKREEQFSKFFKTDNNLTYCTDVVGLMNILKLDSDPAQWRLFIDASEASLKAILLHIGNSYPAIPIGYSNVLKESYDTMEYLLNSINYNTYSWQICADFKVVALITGLQSGYVKHMCYLCVWDSRYKGNQYQKRDWQPRKALLVGQHNIKAHSLVPSNKILMPALHIKLGIMKIFVKAMNKEGEGFKYLKQKFNKLSDAKIHEGVFVGPQIRLLMKDDHFEGLLNILERNAWNSFRKVSTQFLGNHKAQDYKEIIEELMINYEALNCHMSLKLHFLHHHLNNFPPNLGDVSDEHGEKFHQTLMRFEKRYSDNENMLADYCWSIMCDVPNLKFNRQPR